MDNRDQALVKALSSRCDYLTAWEDRFVQSIEFWMKSKNQLTLKQRNTADKIWNERGDKKGLMYKRE